MPSRPRSLTPTRRSTPLRSRKSLTPTRRSARIRTRNSIDLASSTPEEMALRILLLEERVSEMESKTTPNNIESLLPEVTVELLTRGGNTDEIDAIRDDLMEALSEVKDTKSLLENALKNHNLSMRREKELIARIDHLTNQNQDLLKYENKSYHLEIENEALSKQKKDLLAKNQRLVLEKEALEDLVATQTEEKDSLELKFDKLVGEYDKSVKMLEPIFTSKCTPVKGKETSLE